MRLFQHEFFCFSAPSQRLRWITKKMLFHHIKNEIWVKIHSMYFSSNKNIIIFLKVYLCTVDQLDPHFVKELYNHCLIFKNKQQFKSSNQSMILLEMTQYIRGHKKSSSNSNILSSKYWMRKRSYNNIILCTHLPGERTQEMFGLTVI